MTDGATAIPEVQALLRALAASRDVAEMGAACGETAAVLSETALVEPGGILVKDDLLPGRPVDGDEARELLLRDPRLAAAEILATPAMAVIVAVKR